MSAVFLHVGQCGNQIGKAFWRKTSQDKAVHEGHTFIHPDGKQRSVHVDSEPKVVQKACKEMKTLYLEREEEEKLGISGEDHILEDTANQVRKEIEKCDMYSGCIMMHSLTGGTGSGLGSRLCEAMREEYPMNHLISCTVAPCLTGESPLQNYNALLTLSYLQRNTDCVVLTYNDDILGKLQRKMESVSFDAMNTSIASALGGVFLPTDTMTPKSGPSIGMEPWEMIRSVCPHPANKFVQVLHTAKSKLSLAGLQKKMSKTIRRHDSKGNVFGSIGNVVIARGDSTDTFYPQMIQGLEKKFRKSFNTVSWNPFPIDVWTAKTNSIGPNDTASITVASNSESIVEFHETVYEKSRVKFAAKAYIHWYNKYGVTNEDFEEAFDVVEDIIQNYKRLFARVNGLIDWAAAIAAAGMAASAVTSGASVLNGLLGGSGYSVACTVEVENWTKYPLIYPESYINGGIIQAPPVVVRPGQREQFNTATSTYGTASWLISSTGKRSVVMWSCPYSFDLNSNELGVGLTDKGVIQHKDWSQQMESGTSGSGLNLRLGEYYQHTETISIKDSQFEVTGIMGTSHKAKARFIVRPFELNDLADSLKVQVEKVPIVG
ncbi:TUBD [Mytilus coruscus]|uniref:Tubulin delta chain n=1 Tax=Mytilus coruscus TaxID=42192 RepID=A0A6J8EL42_MYTCO|nr:TUBD [Mytilus coruscus]